MLPRLSEEEKERYQRQLIIPEWGEEAQERLKESVVFIAGAGGLGSPVALYLAAAGVGTLRICDRGRIERSNLNRQILHGESDINRKKVDSARENIARVNPHTEVQSLETEIERRNLPSLVGEARLLVDCLDNFLTRLMLNAFAVERGLALIHAGVMGLSGQITFIHPPETPCLACIIPEAPDQGLIPILGATAGVIGSLQAAEALKYLTGTGSLLKSRLLFWDGGTMQFQEITLEKDPECRVCGPCRPTTT